MPPFLFAASALTRLSLSPSALPNVVNWPLRHRPNPVTVPAQIDPSWSCTKVVTSLPARPSFVVQVSNRPFCSRLSPRLVPIHSAPFRSSSSASTCRLGSPSRRPKTVKRTPSNRASPSSVASHRYPSRVCKIALTELCGRPSSTCQERTTKGEASGTRLPTRRCMARSALRGGAARQEQPHESIGRGQIART